MADLAGTQGDFCFYDSHCHLDFDDFDADRDELLMRARRAGMVGLINPGIDLPSSVAACRLAQNYPGLIYPAIGFHPNYGYLWQDDSADALRALARENPVVAIGEIGLDFYREHCSPAQQYHALEEQLKLAAELHLPVILHDRDASKELAPILHSWLAGLPPEHPLRSAPGVLHAYADDFQTAQAFLEDGFYFGLGGPLSYHNAGERLETACRLPLERILLETDAPFLSPHPHRGKRNEPAYIAIIATRLAEARGISLEELGEQTCQNTRKLFGLPA